MRNKIVKPIIMNIDSDQKYLKENEYRYSLNGRVLSYDGRSTRYQSIDGTEEAFQIPEGTTPLGYAEFDTLLFVFYTNLNSPDDLFNAEPICGIGVHIMGSTKKYILRTMTTNYESEFPFPNNSIAPKNNFTILSQYSCLNFYLKYRIECEIEVNFDNTISLYFTDNYNPIRTYNTGINYSNINLNHKDTVCTKFELQSKFIMPKIETPDELQPEFPLGPFIISGDLTCGIYRVAVRYLDSNYNPTDWSYLSKTIYIGEGGSLEEWWKYDGGDENQKSGKGFRLKIYPIDLSFNYIQLGIVKFPKEGYATEFKISRKYRIDIFDPYSINGNIMYIMYRGSIDDELTESLEELSIDRLKILTAKTITILNNRLFIGNIKQNIIKSKEIQKLINENIDFYFEVDRRNQSVDINKNYFYAKERMGQRHPNTLGNGSPYDINREKKHAIFLYQQSYETKFIPGTDYIPSTTIGTYNNSSINGFGHYRNPWMCFNRVGYFRDQEYTIGIQLVYKDGRKSPIFAVYHPNSYDLKVHKSKKVEDIVEYDYFSGRPNFQKIRPLALVVTGIKKLLAALEDDIQGICVHRSDRINDVIIMQGLRQPVCPINNNNPGRFGGQEIDNMLVRDFSKDFIDGDDLEDIIEESNTIEQVIDYHYDIGKSYNNTSQSMAYRIGENYAIYDQTYGPKRGEFNKPTFFSSDLLFRNDANSDIDSNVYWQPQYCYLLSNYCLSAKRTEMFGMLKDDTEDSINCCYGAEYSTSNGTESGPFTYKYMNNISDFNITKGLVRYCSSVNKEGYLSAVSFNSITEFYPARYFLNGNSNIDDRIQKRSTIKNFKIYQYNGTQDVLGTIHDKGASETQFLNITRDKHASFEIMIDDYKSTDLDMAFNPFNGNHFSYPHPGYGTESDYNLRNRGSSGTDPIYNVKNGYNRNIVGFIGNIRKDIGIGQTLTYYPIEYFIESEINNNDSNKWYCYDGDCFIQQTWFTDIVQTYDQPTDNDINCGNLIGFYSENAINSEFRFVPEFWGNDPTNGPPIDKERDYYPWREKMYMRSGAERKAQVRLAMGDENTIKNYIQSQLSADLNFNSVDKFPTRIYYSEIKIDGNKIDNYRNFKQLNYIDEDINFGEIVKLISISSALASIQNQAINYRQVNQDIAVKSNTDFPIKLGNGEVLKQKPVTITDQYGSQHQFSIIKSDRAIYGVDHRKQCIWRLSGQKFEVLSESKNVSSFVKNWLEENTNDLMYDDYSLYGKIEYTYPCSYPPDFPPPIGTVEMRIIKASIHSHYDPEFNEIYFTFYLEDFRKDCYYVNGKTIVFSENIDAFTTFMFDDLKMNPVIYMKVGNKSLAYSSHIFNFSNERYIHYLNVKNSNKMFLDNYLTIIEIIVNDQKTQIKKFGSFELHANFYKNDKYVYNIPDDTMFLKAKNTYQQSNKIPIKQKIGYDEGNIRRVENVYMTFIPRANNKEEYFKEVLRDYFCDLEIYWSSEAAVKLSLDHINVFYIESHR